VLHREFARRIGLKVSLRGFPGRVMNHLQLPGEPPRDVYIDAFERGKILSDKETAAHLLDLIGEVPDEESWKLVTDTAVILRMLNNLTANASSAGDDARALRYLNTALTLDPPAATHRLQRMLIHAKAGRKEKARADAAYLIAQEPPGIDTSRVFELMESLK
jgi:regulator of sirC expression with transglutaminase-like and TPR domain